MSVEWSLVSEMFFYIVVFALALFGLRRWLSLVAGTWLTAIVINGLTAWSTPTIGYATILQLPLMVENAPFAAGLLIPTLLRWKPNATLLLAVFAFCVMVTIEWFDIVIDRLISGIGCAALIAAAVKSPDVLPSLIALMLRKLGDWSYALYLVHVPVFRIVFIKNPMEPFAGMFLIWVSTAILVGALMGELDLAISRRARAISVPDNQAWISVSNRGVPFWIRRDLSVLFRVHVTTGP